MDYITDKFLPKGSKKRSGQTLESVRAIVVHYTATGGASPQNIFDYWNRTAYDNNASAHVLVGDSNAIQVMPYTEVAWHVGSYHIAPQNKPHQYTEYGMSLIEGSGKATPNYCTIGVEMCQEQQVKGSVLISKETRANTISTVRDLMRAYGVGIENVVTHYGVVGWKACPAIAIGGAGFGKLAPKAKEEITHSRWWGDFKAELSARVLEAKI